MEREQHVQWELTIIGKVERGLKIALGVGQEHTAIRKERQVNVVIYVQLVIIVMKDQCLPLRMNVVIQLFIVLLDHHILSLLILVIILLHSINHHQQDHLNPFVREDLIVLMD